MKKYMTAVVLGLFLYLLMVVFSVPFCLAVVTTPGRIVFPDNILQNYNISVTASATLPGTYNQVMIFGFEAKDLLAKTTPLSYLAIYKVSTAGADLVYRFAPVVPGSVNCPNPLLLEKTQPVQMTSSLAATNKQFKLVTSWGETGADYFGTHPIVFSYDNGKFQAVNFYQGDLAQDPKLKGIMWTQPDFTVTNYFNSKESVQTILTQGVAVTDDWQIKLQFYGDNEPHAAAHKFVTFDFPVFK